MVAENYLIGGMQFHFHILNPHNRLYITRNVLFFQFFGKIKIRQIPNAEYCSPYLNSRNL